MNNFSSAYKIIFIGIILLALFQYEGISANEGSSSFSEENYMQMGTNTAYFKENISGIPDHLKLIEKAQSNNFKLDSIYTTEKQSYAYEKRKWFFTYENGQLKQRKKCFFGETFNLKFSLFYQWHYNSNLQLELYEEYNNPIEGYDTIMLESRTTYNYVGDLLVNKVDYSSGGASASYGVDNDGVMHVYKYEQHFRESKYFYKYNDNGLLDYSYWNLNYMANGDSIYSATYYLYDDNNKLIGRYNGDNENCSTLYNISYSYTDSSSLIVETVSGFSPSIKTDFDLDTLSKNWLQQKYFSIYNSKGQDSIYTYSRKIFPEETVFKQKVQFEYNNEQQLVREVYFLWDSETEIGNWYEQINVNYTYDNYGNLIHFEKIYYDLQYNIWLLQEEHEYFYSKDLTTNIANKNFIDKSLKVYPNPTSNVLLVEGIDEAQDYSIYTMQGCEIQKGKIQNKQIAVFELPQGIYLLQFKNSQNNQIFRFVKD